MCELCVAKARSWELSIKGWFLVQATQDGDTLKEDQYGLVRKNTPEFIFTVTPEPQPEDNLKSWRGKVWDFEEQLQGYPESGYKLITAAMAAGYDPEETPIFRFWLFDYLGKVIRDQEPTEHEDH